MRTKARVLALIALGLCAAGVVLVGVYVYSAPLGLRGALSVPRWARDGLDRDWIAYPIHATLGTTLNWLAAPAFVTEPQWVKAAVHARSDSDAELVGQGLAAVWRRDPEPESFADRVCWQLRGVTRGPTVASDENAGIYCEIMAGRALPRSIGPRSVSPPSRN